MSEVSPSRLGRALGVLVAVACTAAATGCTSPRLPECRGKSVPVNPAVANTTTAPTDAAGSEGRHANGQ